MSQRPPKTPARIVGDFCLSLGRRHPELSREVVGKIVAEVERAFERACELVRLDLERQANAKIAEVEAKLKPHYEGQVAHLAGVLAEFDTERAAELGQLQARVAELEAENAELRAQLKTQIKPRKSKAKRREREVTE